jgi:hypothetical protein
MIGRSGEQKLRPSTEPPIKHSSDLAGHPISRSPDLAMRPHPTPVFTRLSDLPIIRPPGSSAHLEVLLAGVKRNLFTIPIKPP